MNEKVMSIVKSIFGANKEDGDTPEIDTKVYPSFAYSVAGHIAKDYDEFLEGMKGIENVGPIGIIDDINSLTPGQLYDETYRRILTNAIANLNKKLEEFS